MLTPKGHTVVISALQQKAILVYSKSISTTDPNFDASQLAALNGKCKRPFDVRQKHTLR